MTKVIKYLGLVIVIVVGLLYLNKNHSEEVSLIVCNGSFYSDGKPLEKEDIYFKFHKYRWWVHLWNDSDGRVYVDRDGYIDVIFDIEVLSGWGDVVFDKFGGAKRGRYSAMSKTMRYVRGNQLFEGKCVEKTR